MRVMNWNGGMIWKLDSAVASRSSRLLKDSFAVRWHAQRDTALDCWVAKILRNPKRRRCRRTPNLLLDHSWGVFQQPARWNGARQTSCPPVRAERTTTQKDPSI